MKTRQLYADFFTNEKVPGLILIGCTIVSLAVTNTNLGTGYQHFWHGHFAGHSLEFWINDGLMAVFFLLIGLELEREIYIGELSDLQKAAFPGFAALGGMIVPAGIYLAFNYGTDAHSGAGIPMATDIAFALGILSLLGNRVPVSLKIFLTALAVIDDLGAILVIAVFYTKSLSFTSLFIALGIFAVLLILNRLKIKNLIVYLIGGLLMWYFMLNSGIHATITGVLLAFAIPFGNGGYHSASYKLSGWLHTPVSFLILPLFALANTAIVISSDIAETLSQPYSIGIALGLIVGKPLGILLFSFAGVAVGLCKLPSGLNWKMIFGVGFLGGIGFTMSIFITLLAFDDVATISNSKFVILLSSLVAGIIGFLFLKRTLQKMQTKPIQED